MLKRYGEIYYIQIHFDGRRIRQTTRTRDKVAAQEIHDKYLAALWDQKYRSFTPWLHALEQYMIEKRNQPSYSQNLTRLKSLNPWLESLALQEINRGVIGDIKAGLRSPQPVLTRKGAQVLDENGDPVTRTLSPATINRTLTLLRAILNYAVEREWLDSAPRIKLLPVQSKRLVYLTPDEVAALLPHLATHQKEFLIFALATGLRMRNITRLAWSEVNLFNRSITIYPDQHKTGAPLVIPINDEALAILRARHKENALGRVFLYRGKGYDRIGIRALQRAGKAAGVDKHIHPHLLRHTFASWHVMNGTSLFELKELGGWRKLESVLIYAHLSVDHLHAIQHREKIKKLYRAAIK